GTRAAGAAWCSWAAKERRSGVDRRLRQAVKAATAAGAVGPALLGAVQTWLEKLGAPGERRRLGRWLRRHRALLEGDAQLWGTAGYALCTARDHAAAIDWLGGWRARAELEPWMLLNLAVSLAHRHRLPEAAEVSRAALALPADHTRDRHRALVVAEAALRGEFGAPAEVPREDGRPVPFYACLGALVQALRAGLAAGDRRAGWREAQPHLAAAARAMPDLSQQPFLRRYRWRTAAALARRRGGLLTPWWLLAGLYRAGAIR
ncbi:MAG TPA: hypothetical protein VFP50_11270, partial [Anaeromyxobacteraceae bacterium]|nr:hypothetical protein [Anaeromyxobacteraceae bacterium]